MNATFWRGALLSVAVLICAVAVVLALHRTRLDETTVREILLKYQNSGLFKNTGLESYSFDLPRQSFVYPAERTAADVAGFIQRQASDRDKQLPITLPFFQYVEEIGLIFAKNTQFAGKIRVNEEPKADAINIFFLREDSKHVVSHFDRNCVYIGYQNAILCDPKLFLDYFAVIENIQRTFDVLVLDLKSQKPVPIQGQALENVKKLIKQSFVVWVLGHEIGHAVLHKNLVLQSNQQLHYNLDYSAPEIAADAFVADKLAANEALATSFWVSTGEFVQQEYRRILLKQSPSYSQAANFSDRDFLLSSPIALAYSRYQVPPILRALRIVDQLIALQPEIDGTGYHERLTNNISASNVFSRRAAISIGMVVMVVASILAAVSLITHTRRV